MYTYLGDVGGVPRWAAFQRGWCVWRANVVNEGGVLVWKAS